MSPAMPITATKAPRWSRLVSISTAWLAYFDSWYILGLLLTVFASPAEMLAAVVVTPWIDERFVLTLPLCLILHQPSVPVSWQV